MNAQTTEAATAIAPPNEVVLATRVAASAFSNAQELIVDSRAAYEAAASDLTDLRGRWKDIEAQRVHLKEPFLEGGRRIDAFFKVPLDRLQEAAELVKSRMLVFQRAEDERVERERREREERERQERLELERQQREAAERERQAREEAQRLEREAQERADAARRKAEAEAAEARKAGDAEAAAKAEAAAAEAQALADREAQEARERGDAAALQAAQEADNAQAAMDLAEVAPAMPAVVSQASARGVATRKSWKVKSVDKAALVVAAAKAITDGDQDKADQLLVYLSVDESALNKLAGALKGAARVAGVVFGEVANIAATGRR